MINIEIEIEKKKKKRELNSFVVCYRLRRRLNDILFSSSSFRSLYLKISLTHIINISIYFISFRLIFFHFRYVFFSIVITGMEWGKMKGIIFI